jgi:hypothetical protein
MLPLVAAGALLGELELGAGQLEGGDIERRGALGEGERERGGGGFEFDCRYL